MFLWSSYAIVTKNDPLYLLYKNVPSI